MAYALTVLAGVLAGSIPFATLVAERHGVDLRRTADGNPGAWNALEQLGGRRAAPAFLGDGLKGTLAGGVGWLATGSVWGAYAGVLSAMAGHAFPLFARRRGGKAIMTFVGGMVAISPPTALASLLVGLLVGVPRRSGADFARAGVLSAPLTQLLFTPVAQVAATGGLMTFFGVLFLTRRSAPATSGPA